MRALDADRHAVQVEIDEALGQIEVDVVMMEQVLANLIENASLHSGGAQPIDVVASSSEPTRSSSASSTTAAASTRCSGDRIFDEFVRGASDSGRGMGLGLAIVRHLVALHDGTVWHEPTLGRRRRRSSSAMPGGGQPRERRHS